MITRLRYLICFTRYIKIVLNLSRLYMYWNIFQNETSFSKQSLDFIWKVPEWNPGQQLLHLHLTSPGKFLDGNMKLFKPQLIVHTWLWSCQNGYNSFKSQLHGTGEKALSFCLVRRHEPYNKLCVMYVKTTVVSCRADVIKWLLSGRGGALTTYPHLVPRLTKE